MAQIGNPIRRYTVVPLQEPVSPTPERVAPPPPTKAPVRPNPLTKPVNSFHNRWGSSSVITRTRPGEDYPRLKSRRSQ
jgi:hypothetical protein